MNNNFPSTHIPRRIAVFAIVVLGLTPLGAAPIAQGDRDRILSELHASRKMFLDSLAGISQAQWTFKAAPERWSIQETAEHIASAEPFLRGLIVEQIMKSPANPEMAATRAPGNSAGNEAVLKGVNDRSQKAQAPEPIQPKGIYADPKAAIAVFDKERNTTLDYIRDTQDDLRVHFFKGPGGGEMDAVQWMMLLAGHTERHVQQIQEVKQSPNYPKK